MGLLKSTIITLATENNQYHSNFMPVPGTAKDRQKLILVAAFDRIHNISNKKFVHGLSESERKEFYYNSNVCT